MSGRYLSVCSGIEAATVAWHPLGWTPAAFAEIEPFPSAVLNHHYPHVPNLGDMTRFKEWPDAAFNVLVGGTPCQSFSVAGLRKGMADPRGNLALTYLAIADRYRPEWILWENVPGVLSSNGGRDFGAFLGGLGQLGYGFAYRVLDAQYVRMDGFARAVPQRRRRVFVVGYLGDWRRAAAVLFERESLLWNTPPRRETGKGSAVDVAPCLRAGGNETGGDRPYGTDVDTCDSLIPAVSHPLPFVAHALRAEGFDASEDGTGRGTNAGVMPAIAFAENSRAELRLCGGDGAVSSQLTTGGGKPGQGQPCIAQPTPIDMRQASRGEKMTNNRAEGTSGGAPGTGIGEPGDPSPSISTSHPPAIAHGWAVRRLTPLECARLQGFPDDYLDFTYRGKPAADGPKYKALGNSMSVNTMRWIGQRIQMVSDLSAKEAA